MSEEKNIPSENKPAPHPMPIPAPEQTPTPQPESVQQPVSTPAEEPAPAEAPIPAPAPAPVPDQQMPAPYPVPMPGQPIPMPPMPGRPVPMGQPGMPGAVPGGMPGQAPMPPVPPMPGQPGGMPNGAPFGGGPVPPPITPLVLGILSIVFSILFALVGLVLGIIAIVSGNKQLKAYGEAFAPKAKPGRMCGIIGVILSTINMVLAIALMVFAFGVFSSAGSEYIDEMDDYFMEETGSYGELGATDEEFMSVVDDVMAGILQDEGGYLEAGVAEFMADMNDESGHGHRYHGHDGLELFEVAGITAADITNALLEDSSYEVTYCEAIDDIAMVEVTIQAKTLMTQYDTFMVMMEDYDAQNPGWDETYEDAAHVVGDVYMQSFAETAPSEIPLILTLENENGEWVLDEEDTDYIVNSMLYLS